MIAGKNMKKPRPKRAMPKFFSIDDEMKQWSAMMETEIIRLPGVKTKPMFGMTGFYRKGKIFGAVPRTRSLSSSRTILIKFDPLPDRLKKRAEGDARLVAGIVGPGAGWHRFELNTETDLRDALWWMTQAFENVKG